MCILEKKNCIYKEQLLVVCSIPLAPSPSFSGLLHNYSKQLLIDRKVALKLRFSLYSSVSSVFPVIYILKKEKEVRK